MLNESQKKAALRREFLEKRRSFVQSQGLSLGEIHCHVVEQLEALFPEAPGLAASYSPKSNEVDPSGIGSKLSQWQFAYPVVDGDQLSFWIPNGPNAFQQGSFGITEPIPDQSQAVSLEDCQVVLVPGVAFDRRGGRIGYGKGFYDRALQNCQGLKIGIGYTAQVSAEDLPCEKADIHMDWVVTEKFAIQTKQAERNRIDP